MAHPAVEIITLSSSDEDKNETASEHVTHKKTARKSMLNKEKTIKNNSSVKSVSQLKETARKSFSSFDLSNLPADLKVIRTASQVNTKPPNKSKNSQYFPERLNNVTSNSISNSVTLIPIVSGNKKISPSSAVSSTTASNENRTQPGYSRKSKAQYLNPLLQFSKQNSGLTIQSVTVGETKLVSPSSPGIHSSRKHTVEKYPSSLLKQSQSKTQAETVFRITKRLNTFSSELTSVKNHVKSSTKPVLREPFQKSNVMNAKRLNNLGTEISITPLTDSGKKAAVKTDLVKNVYTLDSASTSNKNQQSPISSYLQFSKRNNNLSSAISTDKSKNLISTDRVPAHCLPSKKQKMNSSSLPIELDIAVNIRQNQRRISKLKEGVIDLAVAEAAKTEVYPQELSVKTSLQPPTISSVRKNVPNLLPEITSSYSLSIKPTENKVEPVIIENAEQNKSPSAAVVKSESSKNEASSSKALKQVTSPRLSLKRKAMSIEKNKTKKSKTIIPLHFTHAVSTQRASIPEITLNDSPMPSTSKQKDIHFEKKLKESPLPPTTTEKSPKIETQLNDFTMPLISKKKDLNFEKELKESPLPSTSTKRAQNYVKQLSKPFAVIPPKPVWKKTDKNTKKFEKFLKFCLVKTKSTPEESSKINKKMLKVLNSADKSYINCLKFTKLLESSFKKAVATQEYFVQLQLMKTELDHHKNQQHLPTKLTTVSESMTAASNYDTIPVSASENSIPESTIVVNKNVQVSTFDPIGNVAESMSSDDKDAHVLITETISVVNKYEQVPKAASVDGLAESTSIMNKDVQFPKAASLDSVAESTSIANKDGQVPKVASVDSVAESTSIANKDEQVPKAASVDSVAQSTSIANKDEQVPKAASADSVAESKSIVNKDVQVPTSDSLNSVSKSMSIMPSVFKANIKQESGHTYTSTVISLPSSKGYNQWISENNSISYVTEILKLQPSQGTNIVQENVQSSSNATTLLPVSEYSDKIITSSGVSSHLKLHDSKIESSDTKEKTAGLHIITSVFSRSRAECNKLSRTNVLSLKPDYGKNCDVGVSSMDVDSDVPMPFPADKQSSVPLINGELSNSETEPYISANIVNNMNDSSNSESLLDTHVPFPTEQLFSLSGPVLSTVSCVTEQLQQPEAPDITTPTIVLDDGPVDVEDVPIVVDNVPIVERSSGSSLIQKPETVTLDEIMNEKLKSKIHKLETFLEKLDKRIKKLEASEIPLDGMNDEDSNYILEDRYKRKFNKVWAKLCELKKLRPRIPRKVDKKFIYEGSRHNSVNTAVEKFINKRKPCDRFPTYHDILDLITKVNEVNNLCLRTDQVQSLAVETFNAIGQKLQNMRQRDFQRDFGCSLTDGVRWEDDPADTDPDLKLKLIKSVDEGKQKMQEVINKYADAQVGEEEEVDGDICETSNVEVSEQPDLPDTDPASHSEDEVVSIRELPSTSSRVIDIADSDSQSEPSTEDENRDIQEGRHRALHKKHSTRDWPSTAKIPQSGMGEFQNCPASTEKHPEEPEPSTVKNQIKDEDSNDCLVIQDTFEVNQDDSPELPTLDQLLKNR